MYNKYMKTQKETIKIIEKHLKSMHRFYVHDVGAHRLGKCSYPLVAICSAEEHRWKDGIKNLAEKVRHNILIDLVSLDKPQI